MEFIETPTFTRLILDLLSDDEYLELQNSLVEDPVAARLSRAAVEFVNCVLPLAGTARAAELE